MVYNSMKLKDLTSYLDSEVPLSFQESYDNSGLQVGSPGNEIHMALIALDVTEEVIEEALSNQCDVIVSHHPVIFKELKSLTGKSYTERVLIKAIRNDIAIYSAHTNLDVISNGVSWKMAEKMGLEELNVLLPTDHLLLKLVTYIPESHLEVVRNAIFDAGAGVIGNYDNCGFSTPGTGSFKASEKANPFVGERGKLHFEKEIRFETILYSHLKDKIISALISAHPYEEVAYDIYTLENNNTGIGLGCTGVFKVPVSENEFLKLVSDIFEARGIRYSNQTGKPVRKVALCGGSGSSLINQAISSGADAYLTADIKYHDFFEAENKILLVDTGHFESEKFANRNFKRPNY